MNRAWTCWRWRGFLQRCKREERGLGGCDWEVVKVLGFGGKKGLRRCLDR